MEFAVFGLNFSINRRRASKDFGLKDVKVLNDSTLEYVRSLSREEVEKRIKSVSASAESDLGVKKDILQREGILVIPNYIPENEIDKIRDGAEFIKELISNLMNKEKGYVEEDSFLFQKGTSRLSGYKDLSSYEKTVIQVRDGQDAGMIDIFNVDWLYKEAGLSLRPFFEDDVVRGLLGEDYNGLQAKNLNFYINRSVNETRGFHVDAYRKQVKAFVYLTDVYDLEDGPYTYVKGTHLDSAFRQANQKLAKGLPNSTETPVVPLDNIVPVLAGKGSIVISDQGGSHRGFPQALGHERMIAVMNYSSV